MLTLDTNVTQHNNVTDYNQWLTATTFCRILALVKVLVKNGGADKNELSKFNGRIQRSIWLQG
jgi:hypothetical protein